MNLTIIQADIRKSSIALIDLLGKISELQDEIFCIGICEAYLCCSGDIISFFPSLNIFENNQCILITNGQWQIAAQPSDYNIIAIKGYIFNRQIGIIGFYSKPWLKSNPSIYSMIQDIMSNCLSGHDVYLIGDCNTEHPLWSPSYPRPDAAELVNLIVKFNLKNAFPVKSSLWTYNSDSSKSFLDIIFCSSNRHVTNYLCFDISSCDHRGIQASFELTSQSRYKREIISYSNLFKLAIQYPFMRHDDDDLDFAMLQLDAHITNLMAMSTINHRGLDNFQLTSLVKRRRILKRKIQRVKFSSIEKFQLFRDLLEQLRRCSISLSKLRSKARAKYIKDINRPSPPWMIARKILGRNWVKEKSEFVFHYHNNLLESKSKFLQDFSIRSFPRSIFHPPTEYFNIPHLSNPEWNWICMKLKKKAAIFHTFITSRALGILLQQDLSIRKLIERCFRSKYLPNNYITSKVTLIEKSDGKKLRPIVIIHPFARALDAMCLCIIKRSPNYSSFPHQFGFTEGVGPRDIFIKISEILTPLTKRKSKFVMMITIDVENAFENFQLTEAFNGLREKNVPDCLLEFMEYMLLNRKSTFLDQDNQLLVKTHDRGSWQGSFTGPILYNSATRRVHLQDIFYPPLKRHIFFKTFKSADDILLISEHLAFNTTVTTIETIDQVNHFKDFIMNKAIEHLSQELNKVGLSINKDKSKNIILTNNPDLSSSLNRHDSLNFLGACFVNGDLDSVSLSLERKLRLMETLLKRKSINLVNCPPRVLPYIYETTCNSLLRFFGPLIYPRVNSRILGVCRDLGSLITNIHTSNHQTTVLQILSSYPPEQVVYDAYRSACHANNIFPKFCTTSPMDTLAEQIWLLPLINPTATLLQIGSFTLQGFTRSQIFHIKILKLNERIWIDFCREDTSILSVDLHASNYLEALSWALCYFILGCSTIQKAVLVGNARIFETILASKKFQLKTMLTKVRTCWYIYNESFKSLSPKDGCPLFLSEDISGKLNLNWLHKGVIDDLKTWKFEIHILDDIAMIKGLWRHSTNKFTCRCSRRLSTLHFIYDCPLNRHLIPECLKEYPKYNGSKKFLRSSSNIYDMRAISNFIKKSLRLNVSVRTITLSEIVLFITNIVRIEIINK